jgi:hypothetical protein
MRSEPADLVRGFQMSSPATPSPRPRRKRQVWRHNTPEGDFARFWSGWALVASNGRNPLDNLELLPELGRLCFERVHQLRKDKLSPEQTCKRILEELRPQLELFGELRPPRSSEAR